MTAPQPIPPVTPKDDNSYVDDYQPPVDRITPPPPPVSAPITPPAPAPASTESSESESLQDQNIFYLLGVDDSSDEEKEAFLDELQQVIWEDFIESDAKLLISEEELVKLRQIMAQGDSQDVQDEMVVYLEKLIPDLEEVMLEKALELKEEMVLERINGLREYYLSKPESLAKVDEAKQLVEKDKWHQAAQVLNAIGK